MPKPAPTEEEVKPDGSPERGAKRYGWTMVAVSVLIVMGALGFGRFGYTVILPPMKEGLGLSEVQAADLATGNLIGYLALSLAGGFLASRFGPRVVITTSLACAAAGMAATAAAGSFPAALLARILTGMASGGANVPVLGLLSAWFLSSRRGLATGIGVSGSSVGILITGFALPSLLQLPGGQGWRLAWLVMACITLAIAILCAISVRNRPADAGSPKPKRQPAAAVRWSTVFRTRPLWFLAFVYVLFGFSYIVYCTFFVRFLTLEAGFTMSGAGALWAMIGGASIASGFLWGSVSDRLGRKYGLAIVYLLQGLSYAAIGGLRGVAGPGVSAFFFALTAWSIPAIMAAAAGDLLGPRLAPAGLGLLTLFFGIGQAAGPFIAGRIAEATGSYARAFLLASVVALSGALLSLFLKMKQADPSTRGKRGIDKEADAHG